MDRKDIRRALAKLGIAVRNDRVQKKDIQAFFKRIKAESDEAYKKLWQELKLSPAPKPIPIEELGGYYWIDDDGNLWEAPMLKDGTMETYSGAVGPVTNPQDQGFLNVINKKFGTHFKLSDFSGR